VYDQLFHLTIAAPTAASLVILLLGPRIPSLGERLCIPASAASACLSLALLALGYGGPPSAVMIAGLGPFLLDPLTLVILAYVCGLGFLSMLFSAEQMRSHPRSNRFYAFMTASVALGALTVTSDNILLFLLFWEACTLSLLPLTMIGGTEGASRAAYKAVIFLGLADLGMACAALILVSGSGTLVISEMRLDSGVLAILALFLMTTSSFAKAGAVPMHTWVPDLAEHSPTGVAAYFPASLDKLLGILKLAIVLNLIFRAGWQFSLLVAYLGAATIMIGVAMALVQHDIKRLLSFHAVSQVGYMLLGVGLGTPLGLLGGFFHLINNCTYKACLFFTAGAVQSTTGTRDLGRLGGLWRSMPVTFACALVAALAISGVPPLNGFASKWVLYQAMLDLSAEHPECIGLLIVAMFGSTLTLASFVKYMSGVFLGGSSGGLRGVREAPRRMLAPMVALAALCVAFGLFPQVILYPLSLGVDHMTGEQGAPLSSSSSSSSLFLPISRAGLGTSYGFWSPVLVAAMLSASVVAGLLLHRLAGSAGRIGSEDRKALSAVGDGEKRRKNGVFMGGYEEADAGGAGCPATSLYQPLTTLLQPLYSLADRGGFDALYLRIAGAVPLKPITAVIVIYFLWGLIFLALGLTALTLGLF